MLYQICTKTGELEEGRYESLCFTVEILGRTDRTGRFEELEHAGRGYWTWNDQCTDGIPIFN